MVQTSENRDTNHLKPIATPEHLSQSTASSKGDFYSRLIFILSVILAIGAILTSAVAFAGFVENDTGIIHLISAFILCFGIGALAYMPIGLIALYARKSIGTPLTRWRSIFIILLLLPWPLILFYLFRIDGPIRWVAGISSLYIGLTYIWAMRYFRS